jgi:hypothetical protein
MVSDTALDYLCRKMMTNAITHHNPYQQFLDSLHLKLPENQDSSFLTAYVYKTLRKIIPNRKLLNKPYLIGAQQH